MILMIVPLLAFLFGLLVGGQPERLLAVRLRGLGLVLGAFAAQWLLVRVPDPNPSPWLGGAFLVTYGLLAGFLLLNRALPGCRLALVGTLLNAAVLSANGGFMPLSPATLSALNGAPISSIASHSGQRLLGSKDVVLAPPQARLARLGDTLVVPAPLKQVFSLGDVLVVGGIALLIVGLMQPRPRPVWGRVARGPWVAVVTAGRTRLQRVARWGIAPAHRE